MEDERSAFVRSHIAFVWRTLRRFGLSEADAADATQRVFVIATAKRSLIEPGRERAFLSGIALKVLANMRRTAARKPLVFRGEDLNVDDRAADQPSTEELVDRRRALDTLDAILREMTEELRTVFVLYEVEQMTMVEIAGLLEIPMGTVASRLRRAREYFQACVTQRARLSGETR